MKILFSIRNNPGACIQVKRVIDKLDKRHDVRIAAWNDSSYCFDNVDYIFDACYQETPSVNVSSKIKNLYKWSGYPASATQFSLIDLYESVNEFKPDYVISDFEPLSYSLAKSCKAEFRWCSANHLYDGVFLNKYEKFMTYFDVLSGMYDAFVTKWPKAKTYILSPFRYLKYKKPNEGYAWITPVYVKEKVSNEKTKVVAYLSDMSRVEKLTKIVAGLSTKVVLFRPKGFQTDLVENYDLQDEETYSRHLYSCDSIFTDGDINAISDGVMNCKKIVIAPKLNQYDALIHSSAINEYGYGFECGQVEKMENWGLFELERKLNTKIKKYNLRDYEMNYLYDVLERFANERNI